MIRARAEGGERQRLLMLNRLGLSEAPPDAVLDRITSLAASLFETPMALVTLLDETRQHLRSRFGLELESMPRELSFCDHTIQGDGAMVVPDAHADPRFVDNPYVLDVPKIRSYAGAPLVASDGSKLGALCVLDTVPRTFSAFQLEMLEELAALVIERFELSGGSREQSTLRHELRALVSEAPFDRIAETAAHAIDAPKAVLLVVDGGNALPVGAFGVARSPVPTAADGTLVSAVLANGDVLLVRDVVADRRFEAPCAARGARSLVGAPLFGPDGRGIGIVAAFDTEPRTFSDDDVAAMRACAKLAEAEVAHASRRLFPSVDAARLAHAERRLALLESVVLTTSVPMAITGLAPDDDPTIVYVNEPFTRIFGYAPEEIIGRGASITRAEDFDSAVLARAVAARRALEPITLEYAARRRNGERFWCESTISPVFSDDGSAAGFVSVVADITGRRSAERLSQDRGEILELIANDAPLERILGATVAAAERSMARSAGWIALRRGEVLVTVECGPRLRSVLGGAPADVPLDSVHDPAAIVVRTGEQLVLAPGTALTDWQAEAARRFGIGALVATPIRHADGEVVGSLLHVFNAGSTVPEADLRLSSELAHLAGIASERRRDRDRLEFLANHDTLTGLPNRRLLEERATRAIEAARADGRSRVAIGMCDLDRFKIVNESLGHAAGDLLLRQIGERLSRAARPGDTVARLGGDEFAVLIDRIGPQDDVAAIVSAMLAVFEPSFSVAGHEVFVRACMGVAVFPGDGDDAKTLFVRGESAMNGAWSRGEEIAFPEATDALPEPAGASRIALETSLRHACELGQFKVLFQPLVDLRSREMRGAEALLRWKHPLLGNVLPDEFIRAAEDSGLIVPIGAWVLGEACRFARRWQDDGFDRFVSVNVSARQFDRRDFVTTVMDAVAAAGIEPRRLHLELTESLVMRSPEAAAATLRSLKALGVKISIDDFGTGHASFTYLKRFPLDSLKIDRLFIRDVAFGGGMPDDEAIVRAIVGVARALDLKVVAEGVETEEQAAFLRAIGVPLAQGYLFARALEGEAVYDWRFR